MNDRGGFGRRRRALGRGGIAAAMGATRMSSPTVHKGLRELEADASGRDVLSTNRIRSHGAGRRRARDRQPSLIAARPSQEIEPGMRVDIQWVRGGLVGGQLGQWSSAPFCTPVCGR